MVRLLEEKGLTSMYYATHRLYRSPMYLRAMDWEAMKFHDFEKVAAPGKRLPRRIQIS